MLDIRWRILLVALAGWANRRQLEVIAYLREENRILKEHLGEQRLHRHLIARKWTTLQRRVGRSSVLPQIRSLAIRMARENPTWGVDESRTSRGPTTIASLLRAEGIGPVPERPMSWRTFLAANWDAIAAADFFTTSPRSPDEARSGPVHCRPRQIQARSRV